MTIPRLREFCGRLAGRADPEVERAYGASFDERVADTVDLIDHNEAVLGLETLLSNLGDFEINLATGEKAELDEIIAGMGLEHACPMRYQVIFWHHELPDEPTLLYSEIGVDGFEVRKVEEHANGVRGFAGPGLERGGARLGQSLTPPIAAITTDPQFSGHSLTREEFEAVWTSAVEGDR